MVAYTPRLAVLSQMNIALSMEMLSLYAVVRQHHLLCLKVWRYSSEYGDIKQEPGTQDIAW